MTITQVTQITNHATANAIVLAKFKDLEPTEAEISTLEQRLRNNAIVAISLANAFQEFPHATFVRPTAENGKTGFCIEWLMSIPVPL